MNAKKSKKVLLLASLSTLAVSTAAVMVISFNSESAYRAKATTGVSSSIVFSRDSGTFTKIDDSTASVSGKSFTGATYYAVSHNDADISTTNYVAQYGSKISDERYVSFSTSPTGTDDFEFEAITGIKVWTTSSSAQTMYLGYSSDGTSFSDVETIYASTNPDKYTFSESHKFVRLFGYATYARYVTKIELFYTCGAEPSKEVTSIKVSDEKKVYAQGGEFAEPTVTAVYTDSTEEVVSGATFTGFNSSTVTESQTITVSYGGKSTSYNIKVRPTEASRLINYVGYDVDNYEDVDDLTIFLDVENSTLPNYAEGGSSVTVTPVAASPFKVLEVLDWNERVEVIDNGDGTFSFTMTNYFDSVDLKIHFQFSPDMTGIRVDKPKTSYKVGDTFVSPDVYAVYGEYGEMKLTEGYSFSGFDSSVAVESQTITVTYGDFSTTYTIEIKESGEPSDITGTYVSEKTTGNTKYQSYVTLNDGGTGTYVLYKFTSGGDLWTYEMNISYVADGDDVTLTFVSLGERVKYAGGEGGTRTSYGTMTSLSTWFDPYRPFQGSSYIANTTSQVASINSGILTMKRYSSSTDTGSSLVLNKQ